MKALYLFIGFAILGVIGMAFMGLPVGKFLAGFPIVFILSALAYFVSENDIVKYYGLEVVFWALIFGLLISNTIGVPGWLKSAIKTEYFIKIGPSSRRRGPLRHHRQGGAWMVQSVLVIGVVSLVSGCPQPGLTTNLSYHRLVRVDLRRLAATLPRRVQATRKVSHHLAGLCSHSHAILMP
jgi:hypothetical protein